MFWADTITDEVEKRYADKIKAGEAIVVRDEKLLLVRFMLVRFEVLRFTPLWPMYYAHAV